MKPLYPYQTEGAEWLAQRGRALLADEPGLGKTAQALVAARQIGARRTLVACPASVVDNWIREWRMFAPDMPAPTVFSYDRLRDVAAAHMTDIDWDCLILDEAHYLKNPSAGRTKVLFGEKCDGVGGLVSRCKSVFALTGTPAPNNSSELWALMRAVFPESLCRNGKVMTHWNFQNKFCVLKSNGFGVKITGGKNLDQLRERLAPFCLRRKKTDVLKGLPAISFESLPLSSASAFAAMQKYEQTPEGARIRAALASSDESALAKLTPEVATLRRLIGLAKVPVVIDWCKDWLDSGGEKLVLFAYHKEVITALQGGLLPYHPVSLHGATPADLRQRAVDSFQGNPHYKVFIGQIQAAGIGITLTASSNVVFVESSWVPAENEQAAMRIHRIGQRDACLIRFATLAGSLDEQIQRACRRKLTDIRRLFE